MPEAREWTREELLKNLNEAHDCIAKLEEENRELKAIRDSYETAYQERNKQMELRYKDGMIEGLKFAIRFYMAGE